MSIHWYAHHLGDYNRKTKHLTLLEHGAYRVLLDYYYSNGGPFLDDRKTIYRVCNAIERSERRAVDRILDQFFTVSRPNGDRVWSHKRADKEITKASEISEIRKKAGAKGNNLRWQKGSQMRTQPQPQPHKLASNNGFDEEDYDGEILPSHWQDIAEERGIPNEQIFISWRKFKDTSGCPFKLSRWAAWVARERLQ